MKLSIIVPVYNVEKYLARCLDSLYSLNIEKEVILVNDGSTDRSLEIAEEYEKKYRDITTLIDKKNEGVSIARNTGLKIARGEYVYFFDGDDFLNRDVFEEEVLKFFRQDGEADVLIGNRILYYDGNRTEMTYSIPEELENRKNTGPDYLMKALKGKFWNVQVGTYVYRRTLLTENEITFPEKRIHEDELFAIKVLTAAGTVKAVNRIFFYYVQREGSIMKSPGIEHCTDVFKNLKDLIEIFREEENGELKTVMFNRIKRYYHETLKYSLRQKNREVYEMILKSFKEDCRKYFFKMKKSKKDIELYLIYYFDRPYYFVRNGSKNFRDMRYERKKLKKGLKNKNKC